MSDADRPEQIPRTVDVGPDFAQVFLDAERRLEPRFLRPEQQPGLARVQIGDERYILVRAASLSLRFYELFQEVLGSLLDEETSREAAREVLYDLAHAIGRADARAILVGVDERERRLAFGPVHFAYTGWARVRLKPESVTEGDEAWLHYDHLHSFEAEAFVTRGRKATQPMCVMNAGYSAGWVSESFGTRMESTEIACRARGDASCSFVLAAPPHLEARIASVADQYEDPATPPRFLFGERLLDKLAATEAERDRSRASLIEHQATLAAFFAQAPVGAFFTTHEAGRVLVSGANSAAEGLLGSGLVGKPLAEALGLRRPQRVLEACEQVLAGERGSFHEGKLDYLGRSGEEGVLDLHLFSIGQGQLAVLFRDRTSAVRVEAAQRRADRLEATATLAGGIAHEFNNLMAGVLGHLNVVRRSQPPWEEADLILSEVEAAAQVASKLSLQLVSFARRGNYQMSRLRLSELAERWVKAEPRPEGVTLEFVRATERDEVIGDARQLERLFGELLSNALEAVGEEGSIQVRVDRREVAHGEPHPHRAAALDPGPYVTLEVRDDGSGIPPAVQERMFEPYYSTRSRGRGLGLAAAYGLVRSHGGAFEVESEPGYSTLIRVYLPAMTTSVAGERVVGPSGSGPLRRVTPPLPTLGSSLTDELAGALRVAAEAEAAIRGEVGDQACQPIRDALERCEELAARLREQQLSDQRQAIQPIDPCEMLERLAERLRERLPPDVHLAVVCEGKPTTFEGARRAIENALSTLVFNARDAIGEGGEILLRSRLADGQVWLSVEDRGPGIPPEVLGRAREAFFTTKEEHGTGLGLSLAERVAQAHSGRLELGDREGGGTVAALVFPGGAEEARPTRVLIVDDNQHVGRSTARLLELEGFETELAASAAEALERFDDSIDVVLLDLVLPDRSGRDVFKALRERRPDLPVVLFSGYGEQADVSKLVAEGARFVPKPFEVDELLRALGDVRG